MQNGVQLLALTSKMTHIPALASNCTITGKLQQLLLYSSKNITQGQLLPLYFLFLCISTDFRSGSN